jgi:DNA-binding Lrp family transcriptional regulator
MGLDFTLSEEQLQLRAGAREFADGVLTQVAGALDGIPGPEERFYAIKPFFQQMVDAGFLKALIPDEYGGNKFSSLSFTLAAEELTAEQASRIPVSGPGPSDPGARPAPVVLDPQDAMLLAEVRHEGRIPVAGLAAALGCSQPAASRRLDRLIASGVLSFDVEIAPEHLGYPVEALLWVTVAPGRLEAAAHAAAGHPQVAMAAATSGDTNLLLAVGCRDSADLYDYLAHRLGPLDGVQAVQTAPVVRTIKRAGALLEPDGRDR